MVWFRLEKRKKDSTLWTNFEVDLTEMSIEWVLDLVKEQAKIWDGKLDWRLSFITTEAKKK